MNCSKCRHELMPGAPVTLDSITSLPVCSDCARVQRHVHRRTWLRDAFERYEDRRAAAMGKA